MGAVTALESPESGLADGDLCAKGGRGGRVQVEEAKGRGALEEGARRRASNKESVTMAETSTWCSLVFPMTLYVSEGCGMAPKCVPKSQLHTSLSSSGWWPPDRAGQW
jgi:hypothetical protein